MKKGDILLYGHTHVPACEENDGFVFMNPGSVSLPKNGTSRGYMSLDGNVFEWKTLDGEIFSRYEA
jgi:hypothetical protein